MSGTTSKPQKKEQINKGALQNFVSSAKEIETAKLDTLRIVSSLMVHIFRSHFNFINPLYYKPESDSYPDQTSRRMNKLVNKLSELVLFKRFRRPTALKRDQLAKIRSIAMRRRVWFRVLNRLERGLINLTLKVTDKVRSKALAEALYSIVSTLLKALESKVDLSMRRVGVPLAKKISQIAQKWGNNSAEKWSSDIFFVRFLAVMHLNNPKTFAV